MQFIDINLGSELNCMSKSDSLFCVSHEESLSDERCVLIEDLRFEEPVETRTALSIQITSALEMIRIRVVYLLFILVKDLKLQKVNALLEEIDIAEVLNMKHKLCTCSIHDLSVSPYM